MIFRNGQRIGRRCLTLIEMLIVIAVLSFVGSLVAFGIHAARQKQLFLSEAEEVLKAARMAQDLLLILDADTTLKFQADEEGILYWISVEGGKADSFMRNLNKKRRLKSIHVVEFDDGMADREEGQLSLHFLSSGSSLPKGILRISTALSSKEDSALSRYIAFSGYPSYIRSVSTMEEARSIIEEDNEGGELVVRMMQEEVAQLSQRGTAVEGKSESKKPDEKNSP
ncbi:type II secretion system protein [Estrella lausannensis]|uniref:Putative secreted protein n=1 Tax=Estrella lausannensis TaxID=483423 RepID=A0A0H5DNP0_9BACT|nr:type II secretion system protein [Estrella lausannensis]CRX37413.1 putative secreted protein [Estrella lausannensis]